MNWVARKLQKLLLPVKDWEVQDPGAGGVGVWFTGGSFSLTPHVTEGQGSSLDLLYRGHNPFMRSLPS